MLKKIFLNFVKIILIILPIIVLCINFINTFWGTIYKLNINSDNINIIEELLYKDNIEIENLDNVIEIELCGQGLWDYDSLNFYYSDGKIKSVNLYFPKGEVQQKISDCLSEIDTMITEQSNKIEQLKAHKKGLMQGLFPSLEEADV